MFGNKINWTLPGIQGESYCQVVLWRLKDIRKLVISSTDLRSGAAVLGTLFVVASLCIHLPFSQIPGYQLAIFFSPLPYPWLLLPHSFIFRMTLVYSTQPCSTLTALALSFNSGNAPVFLIEILEKERNPRPHSFCMKSCHTFLLGLQTNCPCTEEPSFSINCVWLPVGSHSQIGFVFSAVLISGAFLVKMNSVLAKMAINI